MATEAVAMTRWCPNARTQRLDGQTAYNRDSDGSAPAETLCMASSCQAWRWAEQTPSQLTSDTMVTGWTFIAAADSPTEADLWREPEATAAARRNGYCGDFGPEVVAE